MANVEVTVTRETKRVLKLDENEIQEALKEWAVLKHGFTEACEVNLSDDYHEPSATIVEVTKE